MNGSKKTEIVTSKSWIKDELLDHYLSAMYSNDRSVLAVPSVSVKSIDQANKIKGIYNDATKTVTKTDLEHVFIPFMIKEPIKSGRQDNDNHPFAEHFGLIHIAMEDGLPADATWLDSKATIMPAEVENAIKLINPNITVHKQGINFKQQVNSHDCGLYIAKNIASINAGEKFTAFGAGEAIAMRRAFCEKANTVAINTTYKFQAQQLKIVSGSGNDNAWNSNDFLYTVSDDLMKALEKGGHNTFVTQFDMAQKTYEHASENPNSFFNEYQKFKIQLDQELAKVSSVDFKPGR